MDNTLIDQETFLFIYKNVCIFYSINYQDSDIINPNVTGDNYKIIYIINKMVQKIVILTNRNQFPEPLKYLVVDLVINDYAMLNADTNPDANNSITSMSEAGRSISYGASSIWQARYDKLLEQQMQDNASQINKFKLLYKVECPYGEN